MSADFTNRDAATLLAALERLYAPVGIADFPQHVMEVIAGFLPDTVRTFDVIHTGTGLVESQVSREVANPERIIALARQFMRQSPIVQYLQQGGKEVVLQPTDFVTQWEFRRTGLYRECFRPLGVEYQIGVVLEIPGCIGGMSISRPGPRNFSEEEKRLVRLLRPHIARAHANSRLLHALQSPVTAGNPQLKSGTAPVAPGLHPNRLSILGLTEREIEVWHWLGKGKRDAEIAAILGISPRTVHKHVQHLFIKLQVETRTAAARVRVALGRG